MYITGMDLEFADYVRRLAKTKKKEINLLVNPYFASEVLYYFDGKDFVKIEKVESYSF